MTIRQIGTQVGTLTSAVARAMITALVVSVGAQSPEPASGRTATHWVGSWGASPAFPNGPEVTNQTVRQIIRLSLGGRAVRVRLSNEMGTAPLVVGAAHLAKPGPMPGSIDSASDRTLTFGGRPTVTLPPGAPAISDPVEMDVKALDHLSVSIFVPRNTGPTATHPLGRAATYF